MLFVDVVGGGRQAGAICALFGLGGTPPPAAREGRALAAASATAVAGCGVDKPDGGAAAAAAACPIVVVTCAGESAKRGVQAATAAVGATLARSDARERASMCGE